MADSEGKKPKKSGGKGKKSNSKPSVSCDTDDQLTCILCSNVFIEPDDKLMECERCDNWFCCGCLKMSDVVYKIMTERKDLHWFCADCEKPAISAVKTDKEIEEKCAAYMSTMTEKIEKIENKLSEKADKSTVEDLDARLKSLEGKGAEKQSASISQGETVRLTIHEAKEREYRIRNIIIHNLPESKKKEVEDKIKDDKEAVKKVLSAIDIDEEDAIEYCSRFNRRDNGEAGKKDDKKPRVTKVIVKSVDLKRKILKNSKTLKDNKDYENIFIGPDLTKMQQIEQYELRKELRERRENGDSDIFIRRGKVVQSRERALQFKGGASNSESEK